MNAIQLVVTISRANAHQCAIELQRTGEGDDLVEQRADSVEEAIITRAQELVKQFGGGFYEKGDGPLA